jgi:hypothetical protein
MPNVQAKEIEFDHATGYGTFQTLANYLDVGYWNESGGRTDRWFDIAANGDQILFNVSWSQSDSNGLTAEGKTLAREALKMYEAVLGINFVETTSQDTTTDIFFGDSDDGAWHSGIMNSGQGGSINYAEINIDGTGPIGDDAFQDFLHEIGHALGLGHQGDYSNGDSYPDDVHWLNDTRQLSTMSYISQTDNTNDGGTSDATNVSAMPVDWLALSDEYGQQGYGVSNAFTGNTTWGFNTNITSTVSAAYNQLAALADTNSFCIVDGGGIDTVDWSGYSSDQKINLTVPTASTTGFGTPSSVGGLVNNMYVAVGTLIENAVSGSGDDTMTGNGAANTIDGGVGTDSIVGGMGADSLIGGGGSDTFSGGNGGDTLYGGNDADVLVGGTDNDVFDYNAFSDSAFGGPIDTIAVGSGGTVAFQGAGATAGDRFDFSGLGDLHFGDNAQGGIWLANVGTVTHCYVNQDNATDAELDVAINDGSVLASAYTAADFLFV